MSSVDKGHMIKRTILVVLLVLAGCLAFAVACSGRDCDETGSCGDYAGPQPHCDGVFYYEDGTTECDTCPRRGDDGVWRWPDGEVSVVEDLNAGTLVGITREGSQRQSQGRPLPKGSNDQV